MRKILCLFTIALCSHYNSGAQDHTGNFTCKSLPVRAGKVTTAKGSNGYADNLVISSKSDEVHSLTAGEVSSVFSTSKDQSKVVIVQYTTDSFITYTQLSSVTVKKGERLEKGQIIGKAGMNKETGENELMVQVWIGKMEKSNIHELTAPEMCSFLKHSDI